MSDQPHARTRPPREHVTAQVRAGQQLHDRLRRVCDAERRARVEVTTIAHRLRRQELRRQLHELPVERLREVTGGRLRLGDLRAHGYTTVLKVWEAQPGSLTRVPGVGQVTEKHARAAARQLATAAERDVRIYLTPDPTDQLLTSLVAALRRYGAVKRHLSPVREPTHQLLDGLAAALPRARWVARRWWWHLLSGRAKQQAKEALAWLAQAPARAANAGIADRLTAAERVLDPPVPPPTALWGEFADHAAEYHTWLAEITGDTVDRDAARGFLPAEIVEKVHAQPLDPRYRRVTLRGYQEFGAKYVLAQRRVLIGDEMGLGKTVQALAAVAHLAAREETHFLVVCPASVLTNWLQEISRHTLLLPHRLHGPADDRDRAIRSWWDNGGVGVTTYETLRHLLPPASPTTVNPVAMLVVDEAHYVKNPATRRTHMVREWVDRVERVLYMTGTPLENRLGEFHQLVGQLQPKLAPELPVDPVILYTPRAFRALVAPVYLRRNQDDVLTELPGLIRTDDWVDAGGKESDAYIRAVATGNFMGMRQIGFAGERPMKLRRLNELVTEAGENHRKVLIFSFFRKTLEIVQGSLMSPCFGPINGSVPPAKRQHIVDEFTRANGHAVLLTQITAGGVGLNIQAASVVILCEPQLKPSTEEQAIARAYRMGQVQTVQVHRLLRTNSVDELLFDRLHDKARLFERYARESAVAEAAPEAVDISEEELIHTVLQRERARLHLTADHSEPAPPDGT